MKLRIELDTGNAAFEGNNCGNEVARILSKFASRIEGTEDYLMVSTANDMKLFDINGNAVGLVKVIK